MDQAAPMDLAKRCRQANRDAKDAGEIERLPPIPLKNPIQGLTARVRQYKDRPSFVTSDRKRLGCPRRIEFRCEREFVLEPAKALGRWLFFGERHHQHRR
jgi:hypothetical protein